MFKPIFKTIDGVFGWWIGCECSSRTGLAWTIEHADGSNGLRFERRVDVQMAIRGLAESGITTDAQMFDIPSYEMERIAYGSLAW